MEISQEEKLAIKRMIPCFKELGENLILESLPGESVQTGEDYIRVARLLERLLSE